MSVLSQIIINSIITGSLYAILALGFNLLYGTVRFFDLSYGSLAVVGAYIVYLLSVIHGMPIELSIPIAVIATGFIGFGLYHLIFRTLRKRKASNLVLLITSLGISTAIQSIIAIIFASEFRSLSQIIHDDTITIFGATFTYVQLNMAIVAVLLFVGVNIFLKKSKLGKAIRAIGDDEEVTRVIGINTSQVIGIVYFISSAIAGLAGIFVGFDTGIDPTRGLTLLLKAVIGSIIGSVGNVFGGVLGSYLLGFAENIGVWFISGGWKDAIAFSLLIVFLILRPRGLMQK